MTFEEEVAYLKDKATDLDKKMQTVLDLVAASPEQTVAKVEIATFPAIVLIFLEHMQQSDKAPRR